MGSLRLGVSEFGADKDRWGRPSRLLPVILIDLVPKAHSIHDGQFEMHVALLEVVGLRPQAYTVLMVTSFLSLEGRVEERIHERGLADPSLPWERSEYQRLGPGRSGWQLDEVGLEDPQLQNEREASLPIHSSLSTPHSPILGGV